MPTAARRIRLCVAPLGSSALATLERTGTGIGSGHHAHAAATFTSSNSQYRGECSTRVLCAVLEHQPCSRSRAPLQNWCCPSLAPRCCGGLERGALDAGRLCAACVRVGIQPQPTASQKLSLQHGPPVHDAACSCGRLLHHAILPRRALWRTPRIRWPHDLCDALDAAQALHSARRGACRAAAD